MNTFIYRCVSKAFDMQPVHVGKPMLQAVETSEAICYIVMISATWQRHASTALPESKSHIINHTCTIIPYEICRPRYVYYIH